MPNDKIVAFSPSPKQEEFINAAFSGKYDTLIFGGGMGGGKSFVSTAILLLLCRIYAGSKWVVVRESLPSLKRTIIPTFEKICPKPFIQKFNRSEQVVNFVNGSQIVFMEESIDRDPELNRFLGVECNGFLFEQIEEISEKLFELSYVRSIPGRWRIPGNLQPPQLIMATCNPADNWVKSRFWEPYKNGTLPDNVFYCPARITDNPHITPKDIENTFKNLDPMSARLYRDGDWDAFVVDGAFMYSFDVTRHIARDLILYDELPLILSFDFNVEPFTCIIGQHSNEFLWVHDELQVNPRGGDQMKEMCDTIREKYPNFVYFVTGDSSGRQRTIHSHRNAYEAIQRYLNIPDNLMRVRSFNLSLVDSRILCNSVLHHFPVRIHERCKTLIQECKSGKFENGKLIKNRQDKKMDSLDAFRYMIDYCLPDFLDFLNGSNNFDNQ